jgi:hypothetical protein
MWGAEPHLSEGIGTPEQDARTRNGRFEWRRRANIAYSRRLHLRDGRIIRSLGDAMALLREHESRPGIDNRDEVLHGLERAQTDEQRQKAAAGFFAWAMELDLNRRPPKQARRA